jgi:hypothetical protein
LPADGVVRLEVLQLDRVVVSKQTNKQTKQNKRHERCLQMPAGASRGCRARCPICMVARQKEEFAPGVKLTFELIIKPAICM